MRWFQVSATQTSPSESTATPHGSFSSPVAGALAPEGAHEVAASVEDLDAAVLGVGDVEVPARVGGETARLGELAVPAARPAEDALGGDDHGVARDSRARSCPGSAAGAARASRCRRRGPCGRRRSSPGIRSGSRARGRATSARRPSASGGSRASPAFRSSVLGEPPGADRDALGVVLVGELFLERALGVPVGDDHGRRGAVDAGRPGRRRVAQVPGERPGGLARHGDQRLPLGNARPDLVEDARAPGPGLPSSGRRRGTRRAWAPARGRRRRSGSRRGASRSR